MARTPVLLITGFLGSGKTSFINWLLHERPDLKISLILNEFGDIKLETQFIQQTGGGEVAELANGCMCCVAKSDVPRMIKLILEKAPQTHYILIEASGLSDPDPIYEALNHPDQAALVRLDSIVCIVDTLNFEKTRTEHQIVMSQVGDADLVLLSKVTEAGPETTTRLKNMFEKIGVNTEVLIWDENLKPEQFLEWTPPDEAATPATPLEPNHDHTHEAYTECWYRSQAVIDRTKFEELLRNLPPEVIRAKGYLNVGSHKLMLQYVAGRWELFPAEWQNEEPHSAVLLLGKVLNCEELLAQFRECEG